MYLGRYHCTKASNILYEVNGKYHIKKKRHVTCEILQSTILFFTC